MVNKIMNKRAIYSGTFDPITNGHIDIIKKALNVFDEVIIAIANSDTKKPMLDISSRVKLAQKATRSLKKVQVMAFDNLLVDFAKEQQIKSIVRGLRAVSDFEYELQMSYANQSLDNEIDTIYLMPTLNNAFISSSIVRNILSYNGDVSHLIPKEIEKYVYSI